MAATTEEPRGARIQWPRRWLRMLLVALAVVVAAELVAQALASRLPEPRLWQSYEAQDKVAQMDALGREGGADVVFVGTSLVNGAIDGRVVQRTLGSRVRAYNAALSAGVPEIMAPWTRDVVLPRLRPKLLVLGVSSLDFSDGAGPKFREALEGSVRGGEATGAEDTLDRAGRWLTDNSDLWRYRFAFREPETLVDAIRGGASTPGGEYGNVEPGGRTHLGEHRVGGADLGPPVGGWRLGRDSPAAIVDLIENAKGRGIRVALVDMPVTQRYVDRHPRGERDFALYLNALQNLARSERVPVFEHHEQRNPSRFIDQVHLRRAAGNELTADVARELARAGLVPGGQVRSGSR
jgi:hypothetical protein